MLFAEFCDTAAIVVSLDAIATAASAVAVVAAAAAAVDDGVSAGIVSDDGGARAIASLASAADMAVRADPGIGRAVFGCGRGENIFFWVASFTWRRVSKHVAVADSTTWDEGGLVVLEAIGGLSHKMVWHWLWQQRQVKHRVSRANPLGTEAV